MKNISMTFKTLTICIFIFAANAWGETLSDITEFSPNGCSASPDGTFTQPEKWKHCCTEHDFAYWQGGGFEQRLNADHRLRTCLNKSGGPGEIYFPFVRSAGLDFWASAWPQQNVKQNVTAEEREAMAAEYELWVSLGRNPDFSFQVTESILLQNLRPDQKALLKIKAQAWFATPEYTQFIKAYSKATGESPQLLY